MFMVNPLSAMSIGEVFSTRPSARIWMEKFMEMQK